MPTGNTLVDILRAHDRDLNASPKLRPALRELLETDRKRRKTIRTHAFLAACFEFTPYDGQLRWRQDRPRSHFKDATSTKRWRTRCAGRIVANSRTLSVTYLGRNETLSPSKVAAVLASGRDYDEIRSVAFEDGDRTNLRRTNLVISFHEAMASKS